MRIAGHFFSDTSLYERNEFAKTIGMYRTPSAVS